MPKIKVNLDEVESGFPIYPDGLFHVRITDKSKIKPAKQGGAPNILWVAEVIDGEFEGKMISWNTSLQANALWNLKGMIEKINVEWDEEGFEMEDCFDEELFVKNKSGETYNDKPVNTITGYFTAEEAATIDQQEEN